MSDALVREFDSQGDDYKRAFQVFLDHTDQKRNARRWLQALVEGLPSKQVFIDAGAGNGEVTRWLAGSFQRTIAIEPNLYLCEQLQRAVPGASVVSRPITEAQPQALGDLILCSHTFYYIDQRRWLEHLERLVSWMAPAGVTVVVLQNRDTDCMAMLERFHGRRFDLPALADAFRAQHGDRYELTTNLDQAHIETRDFQSAYGIAEFMLNLLPFTRPIRRADLESHVQACFATDDGRFRFTCHQDFLQIRPR